MTGRSSIDPVSRPTSRPVWAWCVGARDQASALNFRKRAECGRATRANLVCNALSTHAPPIGAAASVPDHVDPSPKRCGTEAQNGRRVKLVSSQSSIACHVDTLWITLWGNGRVIHTRSITGTTRRVIFGILRLTPIALHTPPLNSSLVRLVHNRSPRVASLPHRCAQRPMNAFGG